MLIGYERSRYNPAVAFLARCQWPARAPFGRAGKSDVQSAPSNVMPYLVSLSKSVALVGSGGLASLTGSRNSRIAMLVRHNAAMFKSIPGKNLPCGFDEVFSCVQSEYRVLRLASIMRFQKGCH
jgi:hypothetical protein